MMGLFARKQPGPRLRAAEEPPESCPAQATIDLFVLRTGRGNWLAAERDSSEITMAAQVTQDTVLIACVPRGTPQASFLMAADGRPVAVEGDGFTGPAVTVRLKRVPDGRVELRHPLVPVRHLGVVTGVPVGKPNRVLFDRIGDPVLDRFELHPVDHDMLTPSGRTVLAEMAAAVHAPMSAAGMLALLHAGTVRAGLAEGLIRLLPADELAKLAQRLVTQRADLALLRRAMPGDAWVDGTLPALLAWDDSGRPTTRRAVSPAAEDHVAVLQTGALRPQAGLALQALARRSLSPRRMAAVLATARNEGPYLLDWVAHHRAIGFEHVVIYSNDNDDGSDELLGALADGGAITWVRNELSPVSRAQWKAYGHAFKVLPDLVDYRWTMVLDIDEYFSFRPGMFASVQDVIGWHEYQHVEALALRWLIFAAGPGDAWRDAPSPRRFVRRDPAVDPVFKSLVRSHLFWDAHCHFPYPTMDQPFAYRIEDGAPCHHMGKLRGIKVPADAVSAENTWVSHYIFRSAGEALIKIARGYALWSADSVKADASVVDARLETLMQHFVGLAEKPLVEDRRTVACAPGLEAELARLRALPGVEAADRAIKSVYPGRIADVCEAFLSSPPRAVRSPAYVKFRAILANLSRAAA